jgi:hypothetical protein
MAGPTLQACGFLSRKIHALLPSPKKPLRNCFLVRLQDSFMVYQPQANQVALYIFNDRIFN